MAEGKRKTKKTHLKEAARGGDVKPRTIKKSRYPGGGARRRYGRLNSAEKIGE